MHGKGFSKRNSLPWLLKKTKFYDECCCRLGFFLSSVRDDAMLDYFTCSTLQQHLQYDWNTMKKRYRTSQAHKNRSLSPANFIIEYFFPRDTVVEYRCFICDLLNKLLNYFFCVWSSYFSTNKPPKNFKNLLHRCHLV